MVQMLKLQFKPCRRKVRQDEPAFLRAFKVVVVRERVLVQVSFPQLGLHLKQICYTEELKLLD